MLQRRAADCGENRDPDGAAEPTECEPRKRSKKGRPRSNQRAVVLGRIKAKPSVAADEAASLDPTCARRRLDPAVGARESLQRGRTREMTAKKQERAVCLIAIFPLAFVAAIRERLHVGKDFLHVAHLVGAAMCSAC